jgi:hypothetical protein
MKECMSKIWMYMVCFNPLKATNTESYLSTQTKCSEWVRTITLGQGGGPNRTITELLFQVINKPELSTRMQFNGKLPTHLNWEGCQQVTQHVDL